MNLANKVFLVGGHLIKRSPFILRNLMNYKSNSLRIVYYHIVSKNTYPYYFDEKAISTDEFRKQIIFFKKNFDIISLSKAINLSRNGESLKRKLVITFDDGFIDNYTVAAPILKDLDCSATFFLIGNCINNKDLMWRNKLIVINKVKKEILHKGIQSISKKFEIETTNFKNLLSWSYHSFSMNHKEEIVNTLWECTMDMSIEEYLEEHSPYMTEIQIKELNNEGFEFGSHSMSHPHFNKLDYNNFEKEIINSKKLIEKIINKEVSSFTYPFGSRADLNFEKRLLKENPSLFDTFLGTKNKLNNSNSTIALWERDNLEFQCEIALSRFLLLSAFRSI